LIEESYIAEMAGRIISLKRKGVGEIGCGEGGGGDGGVVW